MTVYKRETTQELRDRLFERLAFHGDGLSSDPQSNPVKRLAYDISREVEDRSIAFRDIEALIKTLSDEAAINRARRLRERSGLDRIDALRVTVEQMATAETEDGWDAFRQWAESPALGIVLTAHPTFSLSRDIRRVLGDIASADETPATSVEELKRFPYLPKRAPTLVEEHEDTQAALSRIQSALDRINRIILQVARQSFPDQWATLTPHLADAYSWVGYDIDGRTDISWGDALRLRLQEKRDMIAHYLLEAEALTARGANLSALAERLQDALQSARRDLDLFEADLSVPDNLVAAANNLTRNSDRRLLSTEHLMPLLNEAITQSADNLAIDMAVLKARMAAFGLGTARIHFRVNARHINAAMRAAFGLTDGTTDNRTLIKRATAMTQAVKARPVNFASLALERSTAHEKMILIAQIQKYIDSGVPIRLLIAETEDALVPLGALYLAKLYGVDEQIDISPLFETSDALNNGGRIVGKMLENPAYRDYVEARGVFAIQTGFSDAGRFMGQLPATLAIERAQSQLARELDRAGLSHVTALVFNTHGEGLGRGGHPGTVGDRVDYAMSPYAVRQFEKRGIALRHETSFQGGDGFLWFQTDALSEASLLSLVTARFADRSQAEDDPFYTERDFSWDLYRTIQNAQEQLYADPDYVAILGGFGQNLLIPTGSRAVKRAKSGSGADTFDPRQLRAIPHNAILQQFGSPANLFYGVGRAARIDPDKFDALLQNSARARSIFQLVATTLCRTNLSILTSYGRLFDPGFWVSRALSGEEPRLVERSAIIADTLMASAWRSQIMDLSNRLRLDMLQTQQRFDCQAAEDSLTLLHALRLAVIMKMMIIATDLPVVSDSETSQLSVLQRLQTFQIDGIIDDLSARYPRETPSLEWAQALTETTDLPDGHGFSHIADEVIKPLSRARDLARQVTVAVTHHYDAFG
ncbi:MAG: phosphoenolpyruvate carboxylase [Pseudomonadota bacterium]